MIPSLNCPNNGKQAGFSGFCQTLQRHNLQQEDGLPKIISVPVAKYLKSYCFLHPPDLALRSQVKEHWFVHSSSNFTYFHPGRRKFSFILGEMNKNGEINTVVDDKLRHKVFNLDAVLFKFLCCFFVFVLFCFLRLLLMKMTLPVPVSVVRLSTKFWVLGTES